MRLMIGIIFLTVVVPTLLWAKEPATMESGGMGSSMSTQLMPGKIKDERRTVLLTDAERTVVMEQMRQMLASVQGIAYGLSRDDIKTVIQSASLSGMHMMQSVPSQIRMKFPPVFSRMGMMTHKIFDKIAKDTKSVRNPRPTLKLLSRAMQSCLACHATYRFVKSK